MCRLLRLTYLIRRASPSYDTFEEPREEDSEARSVFVSQLAARMTARDLGYFLEDKLGENSVMDSRIVTDRLSRRSKGYVHCDLLFPFCLSLTRYHFFDA